MLYNTGAYKFMELLLHYETFLLTHFVNLFYSIYLTILFKPKVKQLKL